MKYSFVVALFIGAISAGDAGSSRGQANSDAFAPNQITKSQRDPYDVEYDISNNLDSVNNSKLGESLASSGLGAIKDKFLEKQHPFDSNFKSDVDQTSQYLNTDAVHDKVLDDKGIAGSGIKRNDGLRNDDLIDEKAGRVNADFSSCHVGETIIPAIKEQTQVQQAASYSSDSAVQYIAKGCANNNYKLSGSITQNECDVQKGGYNKYKTLCLRGNKNRKYCQNGNKSLINQADNNEHGFELYGIKGALLDEDTLNVTAEPEKEVQEQVDQVIRQAISKAISQAVQYALDQSFEATINI